MGKLFITVQSCTLHQPVLDGRLHPRVALVVDERFTFHTKAKHGPSPTFDETFQVGNIHHLAVIQVFVEHVTTRTTLIPSFLNSVADTAGVGNAGGTGSLGLVSSSRSSGANVLLARCFISVRRLANEVERQRTFYLSTVSRREKSEHRPNNWNDPVGVAGTITLTLKMQDMGYPSDVVEFNNIKEWAYNQNLARLLLCYEPLSIARIDLMCSSAREPTEVRRGMTWEQMESMIYANQMERSRGGNASKSDRTDLSDPPQEGTSRSLPFGEGDSLGEMSPSPPPETFEDILTKLCERGGWSEPPRVSATVSVEGCSSLNLHGLPGYLMDEVYVVLRTPFECYTTPSAALKGDPITCHGGALLEVIDCTKWPLLVVLMGKGSQGAFEIGRTVVRCGALSAERASRRHLFLCSFENPLQPTIRGIVHFTIMSHRFGPVLAEHAQKIDAFYGRLSKFFRRYDIPRVPEVDALVQSRLFDLDDFMEDLVAEYGREPDTVKVTIHLKHLTALRERIDEEMNRKIVRVRVSMGEASVITALLEVRQYTETEIDEVFEFDVVRDTDLLQIEVIKAVDERVVYGTALVSFLRMQRKVVNHCKETLVANAGEESAYLSGNVYFTLQSEGVGHDFKVDTSTENMFRGRLRRYFQRRLPKELHRTGLLVSTVFDMETFMANLSLRRGEEDPTYAIFISVMGCRNMKYRFNRRQPQVVVRSGIDSTTIKVKHEAGMNYFDYCEFYFDRLDDHQIRMVLVDHAEHQSPRAIAWAAVQLHDVQLDHQYSDYVPLYDRKDCAVGSIGLKYTVRDLCLVDRTRVEVLRGLTGQMEAQPVTEHMRQPSVAAENGGHSSQLRLVSRLLSLRRRVLSGSSGRFPESQGALFNSSLGGGGVDSNSLHHQMSNDSFEHGRAPSTVLSDARTGLAVSRCTRNAMDTLVLDFNDFEDTSAPTQMHSRTSSLHREFENVIGRFTIDEQEPETSGYRSGHTPSESYDVAGSGGFHSPHLSDSAFQQSSSQRTAPRRAVTSIRTSEFGLDVNSLPLSAPSPTPKILHVRLFYCSDLQGSLRQMPSPFVVLSTVHETMYSESKEKTVNPHYDENFSFRIVSPEETALRISVLTNTPLGTKKMGDCVLSLRNVQRRQGQTRRVSLIANSHTRGAFEHGYVCLSLMGEGFGLDYTPSFDSENRLRERVQEYLEEEAREHLHRLEWFVGEYHMRESALLSSLKGKNALRHAEEAVQLEVRIHKVSNLFSGGWRAKGRCMVRVSAEHKRLGKTRWAANSSTDLNFIFNETVRVNVFDPRGTFLTLEVMLNDKHKMVGECCIPCVSGHFGGTGMQRHMLVLHAQTPDALPSGYIVASVVNPKSEKSKKRWPSIRPGTLVLDTLKPRKANSIDSQRRRPRNCQGSRTPEDDASLTTDVEMDEVEEGELYVAQRGSVQPAPRRAVFSATESQSSAMSGARLTRHTLAQSGGVVWKEAPAKDEESKRYQRLVRYYSYYKPDDLAMVAVRYATITSVDNHIAKLESLYGPEPGNFTVEVTLKQVKELPLPQGNHQKAREMAVLVRLGLQEFSSRRVMGIQDFCLSEKETYKFRVGLPALEAIEMIVVQFRKNRPEEIGRTRLMLHHVPNNHRKPFRQPVLFRGEQSNITGNLYFEVFTSDFGENVVEEEASESLQALSLFQRSSTMLIQRAMEHPYSGDFPPGPVLDPMNPIFEEVQNRISSPSDTRTQSPHSGGAFSGGEGSAMYEISNNASAGLYGVSSPNNNPMSSTYPSIPGEMSSADGATQISPAGNGALVTLDSLMDLRVDRENLRCKIFDQRKNLVLKTKHFRSEHFRVIQESFRISELNAIPSASYTLVISSPRTIGSVEISRCEFCLSRAVPNGVTHRQLRLFDARDYHYIGLCIIKVRLPPLPMTIIRELRPITVEVLRAADEIVDEVISLVGLYQPGFLHHVDLIVYRSSDIHRLHDNLRDHIIPKSSGTTFLGICSVELAPDIITEREMNRRLYVTCETNGDGTAKAVTFSNGAPLNGVAKKHKLPLGVLRVDLVSPAVDSNPVANALTIRVGVCRTPFSANKGREVGRAVISIRALLSHGVFPAFEKVKVPLVWVTEGANAVGATYVGDITVMAIPLVYSRFNPKLYLNVPSNFDRDLIHQYYQRLWRFAEQCDASLMLELHFMVFEQFLQSSQWSQSLSNYLRQLVVQWGPEPHRPQSTIPERVSLRNPHLQPEGGGTEKTEPKPLFNLKPLRK